MEQALHQLMLAFAKADDDRGTGAASEVVWEDIERALELAREALPGCYMAIVQELREADAEG